jgi:hypothetical protein
MKGPRIEVHALLGKRLSHNKLSTIEEAPREIWVVDIDEGALSSLIVRNEWLTHWHDSHDLCLAAVNVQINLLYRSLKLSWGLWAFKHINWQNVSCFSPLLLLLDGLFPEG